MSSYYYESTIPVFGFFRAFYGFGLLFSIITVVALWILFQKAGEEGWAAIIPFYNLYILYKITWGNGLYFLLLLIPLANIVIYIITLVKLAKAFGKGGGWACGLIFLYPIFICIMAFDKSIVYVGDNPGAGFYAGGAQQGYSNTWQQQSSYNAPNYGAPNYNAPNYGAPNNDNPNYGAPNNDAPNNNTAKFCTNCGSPVSEGDRFCLKCGRPL